jgi:hypothetical protein
MPNRRGLTRWHAILLGGGVAIFLLIGLAAGTPFYAWMGLLLAIAIVVLGISDWRAKGHGWLPTLGWAIPLGALWIAVQWFVEGPKSFSFLLGGVPVMVMSLSPHAARWWYEVVLRRPFKT